MTIYVSDKLQATAATVSGDPTPTTSWQWLRNSSAISGATSSDYVVSADDVGSNISVIQSAINMLGTATATSASDGPVLPFLPSLLFRNAATKGVWYDPSDFDRYMSSLGPELVTNGDFSNGSTGWSVSANGTATVSDGVLTLTNGSFGFQRISQSMTTVVGKTYRITCSNLSTNSRYSVSSANDYGQNVLSVQSVSGAIFTATTTTSYIVLSCYVATNGATATFDNISVRELTAIDTATLYQDAAGTLPVTAVEQPVGLMLDKSKGLVLGPELVTNGDFESGTTTGWTATGASLSATTKSLVVTNTAGYGYATQTFSVTSGKWYQLKISPAAGSANPTTRVGSAAFTYDYLSQVNSPSAVSKVFYATSNNVFIYLTVESASVGATASFDNISVRELPGNHAFNSSGNSANFPVLSARYNLLTKTEDFTGWIAYNVTRATDSLTLTGASGCAYQGSSAFFNSGNYKIRIKIKAGTNQFAYINLQTINSYATIVFDVLNGQVGETKTQGTGWSVSAISLTPAEDGYWLCEATITVGTSKADVFAVGFANALTGNSVDSYGNPTGCTSGRTLFVKQADLRVANDALNQPAYQRVNTATDYDTVGFKPYLKFNGTNQWLQTNSIDFSYGDKMFVSAGVRKLSDAATGILSELSATTDTNNGSFFLLAPSQGATASYRTRSKGTASVDLEIISGYPAPITNVLSFTGNISAPSTTIRVNGSQVTQSTITQGTGNYGNYPLYIGARAGSSLWFNGRLYSLIVAGKLANAVEITETEKYVNGKTAAY